MQVNLGDRVKDLITGLEGIAVGRTEWMHGCIRIIVQPQELKDGKPVETSVFDEPQLIVLQVKLPPEPASERGGPQGANDRVATSRR